MVKLNLAKIEQVLLDSKVSGNQIEKETGIGRNAIARFRRGERDWRQSSVATLSKIQEIIDDGRYRFVYPCQDLIDEVLDDISDFGEDHLVIAIFSKEEIKEGIVVDYCDFAQPTFKTIVFEEDKEEAQAVIEEYQHNLAEAMKSPHQIMKLVDLLTKLQYQNSDL